MDREFYEKILVLICFIMLISLWSCVLKIKDSTHHKTNINNNYTEEVRYDKEK